MSLGEFIEKRFIPWLEFLYSQMDRETKSFSALTVLLVGCLLFEFL